MGWSLAFVIGGVGRAGFWLLNLFLRAQVATNVRLSFVSSFGCTPAVSSFMNIRRVGLRRISVA